MFDLEEFEAACERVAETLREMLVPFEEAVNNLAEALEALLNNPNLWPEHNGVSPKKHGLSLQKKRRYKSSVPYQYIPVAPRNLPYMRRNY